MPEPANGSDAPDLIQPPWPVGGGDMGAMIRAHDWAATPLGPTDTWPAALKIAVSLALDCGFPMNVLWGPDLIQVYNDGFRDVIGEKHPAALGQAARVCCPEIWDITKPLVERVWRGETVMLADRLLPIARHGYPEQAYFTLCYSPLRDESGVIAGVLATVLETTERLRAEASLRESKERLRFVLEGSKLGTWESDISTGELIWSDRTLALFGLPPGTRMNAERFMASIHPEDRARIAAAIRRTLDLNEEYETEYRCIWPDGSTHWVHSRGRRYDDPSGRPVRLGGIAFDITDRKRAEEALRESEERLRVVVEAARLGTWDLNTVTGELIWSDRCLALFGLPPGTKMTFERFMAATHPEDREKITAIVQLRTESEVDFSIETRSVWPDGSVHWVGARGRRYADESGRVVRISGVAIDIDDQKRADAALRESEERLRFVIEGAELGIWDWNMLTNELVWSDRSFALFGLTPGTEMTPDRFLAAVHPDDRNLINPALQRALELNAEYEIELRCVWPDGSVHWIHSRGRLYKDASGRPVRLLGIALDVTNRKRAEAAVRESEERLRFVIEAAELGTWDWNIVTNRITWSDRLFALFGLQPGAELTFDSYIQLLHPEDRERISAAVRRSLDLDAEYEIEYRCIWPDGSVHWLHSRGRCYYDPSGHPVRMRGIAMDITERKRAESAVRDSEERLRLLIDNVREYALIQADIQGRITSWNPGAERLFGYSSAEMLGQLASRLLTPEDRDAGVLEQQIALVSRGERSEDQRWMVRKDGTRFWASWVSEAIRDGTGRLRGFAKVIRDETERRRASEIALQRQKLQSVGLLVGGIAHDFNNLLTGITGNASLIVDEIPPAAAGRVRQILNSAERAAHLTRQLLAYSGKGQFQVQEVDISEAVNAVRGLVQFSIPKSVQLVITVETRLPRIEIDPDQLQQILMNLVINAGEAIGEGNPGRITVATGWSDVESSFVDAVGQEAAPGRYVWVEVRDTGSGIAEENKSRIFDPFFTTKFTGRGLGLAAVAGIVRAQRGAITVESEPGRGSTFRVYLPAAGSRAAPEQAPAQGRKTVLVVDDEDTVRDVASAVLIRRGYRVLTATDGHEALAIFEREGTGIDVVVLDVVMPVMGAHDLIPVLRSRHPGVRIMLTSGYSEAEARRLSEAAPDYAFLAKPFTADEIAAAVDELIGAER